MRRFYHHCRSCHARMHLFDKDDDGERRFYLCEHCGQRETLNTRINGLSEDWPSHVFKKALARGVVTAKGKVVGR